MKHALLNNSLRIAAFAGSLFTSIQPVAAQFYPGYGYGGYGGWGDGSAALYGSDYRQAAAMQAAAQTKQAGRDAAAAQNAVVQSGIRNTLSGEAERRDAMADASQANQDWFFQYQTQQMAQRRAGPYVAQSPAFSMGYAQEGASFGPRGGPPPVALDIIKWPKELQGESFASERAQVEAPYRRTPPKMSEPTPADYRGMIPIIEDMKAVLDWKLRDGMRTSDYNAASDFLNAMEQEATARGAG